MNYLNNITVGTTTADSGLQLNNVEILYTKVQKIYIKAQHKEERQRDLRVNVEIHAGISPVCRKVIFGESVPVISITLTYGPVLDYPLLIIYIRCFIAESVRPAS